MNKSEVFVHLDKGVFGTLSSIKTSQSDPDYVDIWYKPFNSIKKVKYPKPIHKDSKHNLYSTNTHIPGCEERILLVYTNEEGSIVANILSSQNKLIETLRSEKEALRSENTNLKSQIRSLNTGVSKAIADKKAIDKSSREENNEFGFNRFRHF